VTPVTTIWVTTTMLAGIPGEVEYPSAVLVKQALLTRLEYPSAVLVKQALLTRLEYPSAVLVKQALLTLLGVSSVCFTSDTSYNYLGDYNYASRNPR
jgi:hypothetical protein